MLLDFAIMPYVFENKFLDTNIGQQTALIELLRDITQRGMITAINNKEWNKEVLERIKYLPTKSAEKLNALYKILKDRNRIVGHPKFEEFDLKSEEDWLKIAKQLDIKSHFDKIIGTMENESCKTPELAYEDISNIEFGTEAIIQNRENMKKRLDPLLNYARKVTIIDPYFNIVLSRYKESFNLITESMSFRRGERLKDGKIIINARFVDGNSADKPIKRTDTDEYYQKWIKVFKETKDKYGHICQLRLWSDNGKMHERYIITDQCGVNVGLGLDVDNSNTRESNWGFIKYDQLSSKRDAYEENSSSFRLSKVIQA